MINLDSIDYAKLERARDELRYRDWAKVKASPNTYLGLLRDQMLAIQAYAEELEQKAEYDRLTRYGIAQGFIEEEQNYR